MKKSLFLTLLFMVSFLFYYVPNSQAQEREIEVVMQDYLEYLRSGDTEGILSLLTDPLLSERRKLLERNSAYSEFLRDTYRGADMLIRGIKEIGTNKRAVDVEISFGDQGAPLKTRLILKREGGLWKISEEISDM